MQYKLIEIKTSRGKDPSMGVLSVFEGMHDLPFEIKRIYYIYGTKAQVKRGMHAHKKTDQFLVCLNGRVQIHLDDGREKGEVMLDNPTTGLLLPAHYWHDMVWESDNSVLMVAASDYYDEGDYIRDYDQFLEYYKK